MKPEKTPPASPEEKVVPLPRLVKAAAHLRAADVWHGCISVTG
jgi:hypothetical protein